MVRALLLGAYSRKHVFEASTKMPLGKAGEAIAEFDQRLRWTFAHRFADSEYVKPLVSRPVATCTRVVDGVVNAFSSSIRRTVLDHLHAANRRTFTAPKLLRFARRWLHLVISLAGCPTKMVCSWCRMPTIRGSCRRGSFLKHATAPWVSPRWKLPTAVPFCKPDILLQGFAPWAMSGGQQKLWHGLGSVQIAPPPCFAAGIAPLKRTSRRWWLGRCTPP